MNCLKESVIDNYHEYFKNSDITIEDLKSIYNDNKKYKLSHGYFYKGYTISKGSVGYNYGVNIIRGYEFAQTLKDAFAYIDRQGFDVYVSDLLDEYYYSMTKNTKMNLTNLNESKIIKESAKPITLKNIQKFVDEINDFAYNHYDLEDLDFTKKYGKLFDFRIREEGDGWGGTQYVVYDYRGSLDMFDEDSAMTKYIDKLASKYGWYAEPVSGSGDFAFGEA